MLSGGQCSLIDIESSILRPNEGIHVTRKIITDLGILEMRRILHRHNDEIDFLVSQHLLEGRDDLDTGAAILVASDTFGGGRLALHDCV